jgi:hypothetical protein
MKKKRKDNYWETQIVKRSASPANIIELFENKIMPLMWRPLIGSNIECLMLCLKDIDPDFFSQKRRKATLDIMVTIIATSPQWQLMSLEEKTRYCFFGRTQFTKEIVENVEKAVLRLQEDDLLSPDNLLSQI